MITKEEAQVILENYLVEQTRKKARSLDIRDYRPHNGAYVYGADKIENFFVVYVPDNYHSGVGASRMIAISKETGEVVMGGRFGE